MDTINRTLKYVDLYLVHNDLNNIIDCKLPNGYKFVYFNKGDEKVATAMAFYLDIPENDITGNVHWVSVKKEYQGKHLSKPLISET